MKETNPQPDDVRLTSLLRGSRPMPPLPPRFQQNVWLRIEDVEAAAKPTSWLDTLSALISRPRFALATAAALVLAGAFTGAVEGVQHSRHDAQAHYLAAVAPNSLR